MIPIRGLRAPMWQLAPLAPRLEVVRRPAPERKERKPRPIFRWTDAEDDRLRELWTTGLSARAISEALGRSRNSVIGRAYRLDLEFHPNQTGRPRA